ncbi:hypothetical protein SPBR_02082 [Sporothrix brasiliensis 5110]|uniref:Uncharacterized protein n=1 Tax=Sporothrix brasiliensis 5110 TaxID=1398154 RepID=A0A0C2IWW8_9PEZI|nr:uncharacterized protein SPBR_02082 [Sporothrix brasiliensis 5110]KIH91245.1 hypothetical protein SPBR_02082 [Sporothrix brasiliensis 5110]
MWSRALLYAEPAVDAAPPMWHRPSQPGGQLMSLDPVVTSTPMWHRPLVRATDAVPIFEEAVISPSHMWHRPPTATPMCPCCMSPTPAGLAKAERAEAALATPPRSPVSMASFRPSTTATSATRRSSESAFSVSTASSGSGSRAGRRLQYQASSLSLRIKRSFARLRGRSSGESL